MRTQDLYEVEVWIKIDPSSVLAPRCSVLRAACKYELAFSRIYLILYSNRYTVEYGYTAVSVANSVKLLLVNLYIARKYSYVVYSYTFTSLYTTRL